MNKRNAQTLIAYVGILCLCILFTLFLDGISGSYLLGIMLLAPTVSLAVLFAAKLKYKAGLELSASLSDKGDTVFAELTLPRSALFLLCIVTVEVKSSYHFGTDGATTFRIGGSRKDSTHRCKFSCDYFGKGDIYIAGAVATDFLGLISLKIGKDEQRKTVRILPLIKDMNPKNDLTKTLEETAAYNDSEETNDKAAVSVGMPGYEHRNYVPGDSLKMINWKLSAKKDTLLVRKQEGYAIDRQAVILDSRCADPRKAETAHFQEQLLVEGMLALLNTLIKTEVPCDVYIRFGEEWEHIVAETGEQTENLRYRMADFVFDKNNTDRLPVPETDSTKSYVIFTASPDAKFAALISAESAKGTTHECATASDSVSEMLCWHIDDNCGEINISRL